LEHNQNVLPSRDLPWAAFWDRLGGGAISSCLIHQIDALRWYGGEADRVTCMTRSVPERMEGETYGVVLAQMKSGALAELSINWATRQAANGPNALWYEIVRVTGSDGDAHYISGKGVFINSDAATEMSKHVELDGDPGSEGYAKIKTSGIAGHQTMISEWINMLSGRENQVSTTGADVRYTVEISEAAYLAEKEGSTISLPIESVPWGSR
jgi:predicted dehydrogenase